MRSHPAEKAYSRGRRGRGSCFRMARPAPPAKVSSSSRIFAQNGIQAYGIYEVYGALPLVEALGLGARANLVLFVRRFAPYCGDADRN